MKKNSCYWYCPKCKEELDGCHVTYQELCEYCGTAVLSVPESISQETIKEIIKAEAEGRLVALPCKVGETVYFTQNICEYKHCDTHTRMVCCGCPDYAKNKFVIQSRAFTLMDLKDIGKTVFLTREEAEKALGGGEE